ncbi:hypothetical protein [Vallitalea guaymasensis]|uniref:Lipoprotein n=1 Tax=Vallitalea guaymasensis TaxID=1185412 RepID=A0A8J8SBW4_9FIRM|nr:hypothetical protein [Vallitalea guaymasensis]QUH29107.1 hypothetical protein HYG85_09300 [Vallitalea guaymasensis]
MKAKQLLILFCSILILTSCKSKEVEDTSTKIVMKEARTIEEHYAIYTDGKNIYYEDVKNNSTKVLRKCLETIKEILLLPEIDENTDLPNPEDLIKQDEVTPFTYEMSLESSAKYILALQKNGWSIVAEYANYLYRDMYFKKDERYMRVIVLENKLKIFEEIGGELPSPQLYINENK